MNIQDILRQVYADLDRRAHETVDAAGRAPIPGLTGPAGPGAGIPGFPPLPGGPPPPQQFQPTPMGGAPFRPTGSYSSQALRLAGLLGPAPGTGTTFQEQVGMVGGGPKVPQQPFNIPPGKVPGLPGNAPGLLGWPPKGFRIPGGMGMY